MIEKFSFWSSYADAALEMEDDARHEFLDAIINYVFRGKEPVFEHAIAKAVFLVAKPSIDTSIRNSENGKKGGEKDKTTGTNGCDKNRKPAKTKTESPLEEKEKAGLQKNSKHIDIDIDIDKDIEKEKEKKEKEKRKTQNTRFAPPSLSEVEEYLNEYTNEKQVQADFTAESFIDFYASKGWIVGKSRMKDWRAALRGWISRSRNRASPSNVQAMDNPCPAYEVDPNAEGWGHVYTG